MKITIAIPRLSIIICTNNTEIAERYFFTKKDEIISEKIEIILIKNESNSKFNSIASAYNYGASKAKSDLLMFVHHDVVLNDPLELENLISYCKGRNFGIIGSCGISGGHLFYSDRNVTWNNKSLSFASPLPAQVVDEPLFVIKKSTWVEEPFDDTVIDRFHLCATEYSLRMNLLGKPVILFPINMNHFNIGSKDLDEFSSSVKKRNHMSAWVRTAKKLQLKYSNLTIMSMQGPITNGLIIIYSIYYGIVLLSFPVLGYKFTRFLDSNPTLSKIINRFVRNFKYE